MKTRVRRLGDHLLQEVVIPRWVLYLLVMMLLINTAVWGKEMFGG